ncbi:MAG: Carbohydrate-selective porin [uncultured bacterium]|nr:MAG: Carbohydrate-selective porin [uncultured bacterium]HBH17809.1 hypothetical protein [Cyanobacteria bacterium UBA9579]
MIIKYLKFLTILLFISGILSNSACLADESLLEEIVFEKSQNQEDKLTENHYIETSYIDNKIKLYKYLEMHGIIPEINYTTDSFLKLRGKDISQNIKSIGLLNYSVTVDTEKLGLIPGGTAYVLGQNLHAFELSPDFVGDLQGISSIDGPVMNQLGEAWYQQRLIDDKVSVKAGKQDANTDFDALETSVDFINSSFTTIANIPMPTYPDQRFGGAILIEPIEQFNLKTGVYNGVAEQEDIGFRIGREGVFTIVESGIRPNINNHYGNYIIGYWYASKNIEEIPLNNNARVFSGNYGVYAGLEQQIYKENNEDEQGLYIQGQYGWSPSNRNEIARFYSASCAYYGLIPKRDNDVLGFGTAIANLSSRIKNIENKKDEIVLEGFYKVEITPWLALEPDMQYIFNPDGNNKNAFIIGVRTLISF